MKLSISNIAWGAEDDLEVYSYLKNNGYSGLEIAPTRIFPVAPYDKLHEAEEWALNLKGEYNLEISSMQSIWYGRSEEIVKDNDQRKSLLDYTKKAILFAEKIKCRNLVFGNPRNRVVNNLSVDLPILVNFFKEIGEFALEHNTVIALEPNPVIYNTNFMNDTQETISVIDRVGLESIMLNFDLGACIYNNEDCVNDFASYSRYINHIHISEPYLKKIEKRSDLHQQLIQSVKSYCPDKFLSIEMGKQEISDVKEVITYVKNITDA